MDKRYYYRLLGVHEDATDAQIREAYEEKLQKLKGDDYADDPEYVRRKTAEVKNAYSVLTGKDAPATKAQREARFERLKDALDQGEDGVETLKAKLRRAANDVEDVDERRESTEQEGGTGGKRVVYTYGGTNAQNRSKSKMTKGKIVTICIVLWIAFGIISAVIDFAAIDFSSVEDDTGTDNARVYDTMTIETVDNILKIGGAYDYEGHLNDKKIEKNLDRVTWSAEDADEEAAGEQMFLLLDAFYCPRYDEAIDYMAEAYGDGSAGFYEENDDYTCMLMVLYCIDAPSYESVAGMTNTYRDEAILTYTDYFHFIVDVAEAQTDALLEEYGLA